MSNTPKLFLSSGRDRRGEMRKYRDGLQGSGFEVKSEWLDPSPMEDMDVWESAPLFALTSINDLLNTDICIVFPSTNDYLDSGYQHVEFGLALAYDKTCVVVGARRNAYHYLSDVFYFDTWNECMDWLYEVKAEWNDD